MDEAFDAKPWRKYKEEDDKYFVPYKAFRLLYHDVEMEDPGAAFWEAIQQNNFGLGFDLKNGLKIPFRFCDKSTKPNFQHLHYLTPWAILEFNFIIQGTVSAPL